MALLKPLAEIVLSASRVRSSGGGTARFAGNGRAGAEKRSTAVATQGQQNVKIIAGRVLNLVDRPDA